jgi:uncharacterized membrane protein
VSVCPCSVISSAAARLTNNKPFTDTYKLELGLPGAKWSGFMQNTAGDISLEAYGTAEIRPLWITPGCTVAPGVYDVKIKATSYTRATDIAEGLLKVRVLSCHAVKLSPGEQSWKMCSGGKTSFSVSAENEGKYNETFAVSSPVSWAGIVPAGVLLNAGESKKITVALEPPMGFYGEQNVTVRVKSMDSPAEDTAVMHLILDDCLSFSAVLQPEETKGCVSKSSGFTLTVINTGKSADTYIISASSGARVAQNNAVIEPGDRKELKVEMVPASEGIHNFSVTVRSSKEETEKTLYGTVSASSCVGAEIFVTPAQASVCVGEEVRYNVAVRNTGQVQSSFDVSTTEGKLSKTKTDLAPGKSETVMLSVPAPAAGNMTIKVSVSSGAFSAASIVVLSARKCRSAEVTAEPAEISACQCGSAAFAATVKNTGEMDGNYILVMSGDLGNYTSSLNLRAGQSEERINVKIDIACDAVPDTYDMPLQLKSGNSVMSSAGAAVKVEPKEKCYSVSLSANSTEILKDKPNVVPVEIANGLQASDFQLYLDAPDWVYMSHNRTSLTAGERGEIYLYVSPSYDTEPGNYTVVIYADSGIADAKLVLSVMVTENSTKAELKGGPPTGAEIAGTAPGWKGVVIGIMAIVIAAIISIRFFFIAPR